MPNASTQSAERGWQIYKRKMEKDPDVGRATINVGLTKLGYDSVAARTFRHYESMYRTGWRGGYYPINKFDVMRSTGAWPPGP